MVPKSLSDESDRKTPNVYNKSVTCQLREIHIRRTVMPEQKTDTKSLAHTTWNCKYHIVFAPKFRRKVFFNEKRADIREIIRTLCQWKGGRNHRGRDLSGSYPSAAEHSAKILGFGFYGISEGKKQLNDLPKVWEHEIRIPKPRILV